MSAYLQSCTVGGNPLWWATEGGSRRERKQRKINEMSNRCYNENKSVSQISMGDRRCCENHYKSIMSVYPDPALWPFHNVQRFLSKHI